MRLTAARRTFGFAADLTFLFAAMLSLWWLLAAACMTGCGRTADLGDDQGDAQTDETGGDGATDALSDADGSSDAAVTSLSVDPATLTLPAGSTRALTARALKSDGTTADVTSSVAWSCDSPAVAKVDATGLVIAIAAGTAKITATLGGVSAQSLLTVPAASVTDLKIDPGSAETAIGGTVTFAATAVFSDGSSTDVTASATWTVDDGSVAKVSFGVVTGLAAGTTNVHAAIGGKTASAALVVDAKALVSLEIAPTAPALGVSVSMPLVATALYGDGSKADVTTSATWSSSAPAIATIGATGTLTGVSAGTSTITATFGGKSATTTATITAAALGSIVVSPSAATLSVGGNATLKATATYLDGTTSDVTTSAVWTSSDATIAAVSSGMVSGVAEGSATVNASFGGKSGIASITVSPAKLLSLTISPSDPSLPLGATLSLHATGVYEGGSTRDVTTDVTWSTDDATIATISNASGSNGRATPVAVGKTTVRATLSGVSSSTSLTVTAATVTSIAIAPTSLTMVNGTKQFATATATYSDGTSVDVTAKCTWSTASTAVATVSNGTGSQGLVTATGVGSTTLSCALSGVTGSASITVTAATLDTVSISPVAPTCHVGDTLRFSATAISTSGMGTNVTNAATWSATPAGLLTKLPQPGAFRCAAKGSATVSATYKGVTGSTPVTITDAVVTGVQVDPVTLSLPIGGKQAYTATAIYSDGSTVTVTNMATWVSTSPAVASITTGGGGPGGGGRGQATALSAGTTTIQATYGGFTGKATLTVTSAVLTSITVAPATTAAPVGVKLTFTATANYSDGTSKDVTTAASWTSSDTTLAQVSDAGPTRGQATTLAAGTVTITAYFGGFSGKATLTVTTATLSSIAVTPATSSVSVGSTVVLKAYGVYSDGSKFEVTSSATWTSSDTSIATVSSTAGTAGQATAVSAGSATIRASYGGLTGSASLTVL